MPDLSNSSLWYPICNETLNKTGEDRIQPFSFPVLFSNRFLKIYATTTDTTLRYGGSISLMIGSINSPTPIYSTKRNLILNQWKLIDLILIEQAVSSQFYLIYSVPWWFVDVHLQVYQYQETL
ncbi:MAG TPA: hypothetical protein V6D21_16525 [Candidatus Obscuribacterales bacterium]